MFDKIFEMTKIAYYHIYHIWFISPSSVTRSSHLNSKGGFWEINQIQLIIMQFCALPGIVNFSSYMVCRVYYSHTPPPTRKAAKRSLYSHYANFARTSAIVVFQRNFKDYKQNNFYKKGDIKPEK